MQVSKIGERVRTESRNMHETRQLTSRRQPRFVAGQRDRWGKDDGGPFRKDHVAGLRDDHTVCRAIRDGRECGRAPRRKGDDVSLAEPLEERTLLRLGHRGTPGLNSPRQAGLHGLGRRLKLTVDVVSLRRQGHPGFVKETPA